MSHPSHSPVPEAGSDRSEILTVDFRPQLRDALANAAPLEPEDPLQNHNAARLYEQYPDDHIIMFHVFEPEAHVVAVTNPNDYLELLRQAAEVLDASRPTISKNLKAIQERDAVLKRAAEHELEHGVVVNKFGNSDTIIFYGVAFLLDEDGEYVFWPFYDIQGPIRKVHVALANVAPHDASDIDLEIMRDLGYASAEEVRQHAEGVPAVEEGWQRIVTKDDVLAALSFLLTQE